jgi:dihydrofolate reductase
MVLYQMKERHIIAAVANGNGIGYNGKLLWRIPSDLRRFKELTTGNVVVMGRKTYESIGKPLPNRENIVVTSQYIDGVHCVKTLQEAYDLAENLTGHKVFVIGGGQLYQEALSGVDVLDITRILDVPDKVDTFFPQDLSGFILTDMTDIYNDGPKYQFMTYKNKKFLNLY